MLRRICITVFLATCPLTSVFAQQCLHGENQTAANKARVQMAVRAMRTLNTAQIQFRSEFNRYSTSQTDLENQFWQRSQNSRSALGLSTVPGTDILPDFQLLLIGDGNTYAMVLSDKLDPCHGTLYTDHRGIIYSGYSAELCGQAH